MDLFKLPGVAETIDWTQALMQLDALVLDPKTVDNTLGVLLKYQDDIARIQGRQAAKILAQVRAEVAAGRCGGTGESVPLRHCAAPSPRRREPPPLPPREP